MKNNKSPSVGINRAKPWQLFLFTFNNGATNCYFVLTMNYTAYHANGVLGLTMMFATTMVTATRVLDGIMDPVIGAIVDKTQTRFGKFRPFIILGNAILAISGLLIYFATRLIPATMMQLRYIALILFYIIFVIGYTFQTTCTRSGQTCITNDPKQRPLFNIFNTLSSLVGMGVIMAVSSLWGGKVGFGTTRFFDLIVPMVIIISIVLTILAVIGIAEKDRPEFYGMEGGKQQELKFCDYLGILKGNKELRKLIVAGAGNKLASSIAQNSTISIILFACMMGNYNGLYLPCYILGYVGAIPFFIINLNLSRKHGQKHAMSICNGIALTMYVGVLIMLFIWQPGNTATLLSFTNINLYTIVFLLCYMIGFGSFYTTSDMVIPMIADCSDYEIYRSGNYVPGIVGALFSMVDKFISSLSTTIVGLVVLIVLGMNQLPDVQTEYISGMNFVVIILFCGLPMVSWMASLISMQFYKLSGGRMKEIQAVNAIRKDAICKGMSKEEAMCKWVTMDQVPKEYWVE